MVNGRAIDSKVARVDTGGSETIYYYLGYALGTAHELADTSGNVVRQVLYTAWGEDHPDYTSTTTVDDRHGFSQRENDTESSLMHFRARSYDPRTGRFIQLDPVDDRKATAHYVYASNQPIQRIDPRGLWDYDKDSRGSVNDRRLFELAVADAKRAVRAAQLEKPVLGLPVEPLIGKKHNGPNIGTKAVLKALTKGSPPIIRFRAHDEKPFKGVGEFVEAGTNHSGHVVLINTGLWGGLGMEGRAATLVHEIAHSLWRRSRTQLTYKFFSTWSQFITKSGRRQIGTNIQVVPGLEPNAADSEGWWMHYRVYPNRVRVQAKSHPSANILQLSRLR